MSVTPYRTIASPIVASTAFVMELTLVPLLLPIIQSGYDLTVGDIAWFFNVYGIAVALGVIAGGWVGDVFGARRIFGTGVLMFTLGALVVISAEGFMTLLIGRALQGFGGGLFSPVVPVLLTKALPQKPGKILIIWGSVTGYVAAFAPLAAGWAIGLFGWQSVFALFAIMASAALALSLDRAPEVAPTRGRVLPNLRLLFGIRNLWFVFGYIFCTYGAITFYLFSLPFRLTDGGFGAEAIGILLAAIWLSFSVSSTLLRNSVDGPQITWVVMAAPLLIAGSFFTAYLSDHILMLLASAVLIGAGFACSNAPSTQLVLKFAPDGLRSVSTSLDITFARLGGVATVALLAQLDIALSFAAVILFSLSAGVLARVVSKEFA
ncbi:MFS transporter [Thalassococcus sp. BH17M4-6]|uniref:MFS transporter n=1 Tax=Thalassococcus sp. BH17M4-6 TaxID=3413148 RepID=UPI003BCC3A8A